MEGTNDFASASQVLVQIRGATQSLVHEYFCQTVYLYLKVPYPSTLVSVMTYHLLSEDRSLAERAGNID